MNAPPDVEPDDTARERRAQRRAALKLTHPDMGGTTEAFYAALTASRHPVSDPGDIVIRVTLRGRLRRARRQVRHASHAVRTRLPHRGSGAP